MATRIGKRVTTIGMVTGAPAIIAAFALTDIYAFRANSRFDELTDRVRRDLSTEGPTAVCGVQHREPRSSARIEFSARRAPSLTAAGCFRRPHDRLPRLARGFSRQPARGSPDDRQPRACRCTTVWLQQPCRCNHAVGVVAPVAGHHVTATPRDRARPRASEDESPPPSSAICLFPHGMTGGW